MTLSDRLHRELTGRRLIFNVLFYSSHLLLFAYGWWKQASDPRLAGLNTLRYSVWSSRGAGLCLGYDGALLLLPLLRNLIMVLRPRLAWLLPLDENLWFHRQVAYSMLFFTIVHTTAHYVNFILVELTQIRQETAVEIHYTQPGGFTGHFMLLLMFLIYPTSSHRVRTTSFETFWYTHHLSFFFLLGLYTHATGCFVRGSLPSEPVQCLGYNTWRFTIWGGLAYFFERLIREARSRRSTKLVAVLDHPGRVVQLRIQKPSFRYKSGQWLFLQVPKVSGLQWHPFTISSAPDDPFVSVHIRRVGDWTNELAKALGCDDNDDAGGKYGYGIEKTDTTLSNVPLLTSSLDAPGPSTGGRLLSHSRTPSSGQALRQIGDLPKIRIDGPYGAPTEDVFNYGVAVLVGAGIGVTPFASILKNIWWMRKKGRLGALRRVEFVWVNRDTAAFEWFQELLLSLEHEFSSPTSSSSSPPSSSSFLRIRTYLTGPLPSDTLAHLAVNIDSDTDPLTDLHSKTLFGRPDFGKMFEEMKKGMNDGSYLAGLEASLRQRVGVFYCGPQGLAKKLREETGRASREGGVRFDFFKEHF